MCRIFKILTRVFDSALLLCFTYDQHALEHIASMNGFLNITCVHACNSAIEPARDATVLELMWRHVQTMSA